MHFANRIGVAVLWCTLLSPLLPILVAAWICKLLESEHVKAAPPSGFSDGGNSAPGRANKAALQFSFGMGYRPWLR